MNYIKGTLKDILYLSENFISLETSALAASAVILFLTFIVAAGKLLRFYTRKRKLFQKIGEDLRDRRVVVAQLPEEHSGAADHHDNYITIIH